MLGKSFHIAKMITFWGKNECVGIKQAKEKKRGKSISITYIHQEIKRQIFISVFTRTHINKSI